MGRGPGRFARPDEVRVQTLDARPAQQGNPCAERIEQVPQIVTVRLGYLVPQFGSASRDQVHEPAERSPVPLPRSAAQAKLARPAVQCGMQLAQEVRGFGVRAIVLSAGVVATPVFLAVATEDDVAMYRDCVGISEPEAVVPRA